MEGNSLTVRTSLDDPQLAVDNAQSRRKTAAGYLTKMADAITRYEQAQAHWHAITNAYRKPGRPDYEAERKAATDTRRVRAEALQAFWSNEATMYALAAIAAKENP